MKFSVLIIILFCTCFSSKEAIKFQILISEGRIYEKRSGKQLHNLEYLKRKELIAVDDNSYLVIVDNAANYYEFEGPTVVNLKNIDIIGRHMNWLEIEVLYQDSYRGSSIEWNLPVVVYEPYNANNGIFADDSVCLKWVDKSQDIHSKYIVKVVDMQRNAVFDTTIGNREFTVKPIQESPYILTILDESDNRISLEYGLIYSNKTIKSRSESAVESVLTGLHLEKISEYELATSYIRQATILSERPTFKKILQHHLNRLKSIGL